MTKLINNHITDDHGHLTKGKVYYGEPTGWKVLNNEQTLWITDDKGVSIGITVGDMCYQAQNDKWEIIE